MHAAAEHFVDIAHGERDVIQAALTARQASKNVVVAAVRRAAHESRRGPDNGPTFRKPSSS
jgi:hypothetical protein